MIHVRPFRAWRPAPHTAHLVGSRSFLNYSTEQLREKLAGNPYTFLHIVYADHDRHGLTRAEHFDGVRRKFTEFTEKHILQREEHPAFYLYEQSCGAFTSRGIIGAVAVTDYREGRVKVHEQTLATREELFSDYLDHTGINAEPVLLAVPDAPDLEAALDDIAQRPTLYDFCTTDQVRHRFWKVDAPEELVALGGHFKRMPAMYIADGHHRCASSARLADCLHADPQGPKSAFLAFMVPERQLHIYNYDRTVKGLNGLSEEAFLTELRKVGTLTPLSGGPGEPDPQSVQVHVKSGWYALALPKTSGNNPVDALDAAVLSEAVLGPVLGISDLRTDPRIRFVPGTHDTSELEQAISSGKADVAFHLRAVTFNEMRTVADSGRCMPPKTTWIEPKLRSGLTIYSLEDH
ncbi:MAG: DUF1015 domain-containing protein [Flavobacteriales bacterium]|jgi:uncharacterized protein (DUF1015 family)|nr:DUF1015 domain-containing protein [Flavobacteriales bacterium]MBK6894109.1 DUF1015 domain-containing protein [Flavobacteriales bacterium]MBK7248048.1 DUF1015 domain-containing protein [Flavobacteriales bacterium]MBK9059764.1 DUF1015 domain-containing protein [Flavobacteriales bacterium]MBK9598406.1 DUF1015 domain-containing protein [Flavobacteriales bacterium]